MTLNEANSIMEQRKKTENYCLCLCIIPHYHRSSSKICQLLKKGKKKKIGRGELKNEVRMALVTLLPSKKKRTIKNPLQKTSGRTWQKNDIVVKNNRKSRWWKTEMASSWLRTCNRPMTAQQCDVTHALWDAKMEERKKELKALLQGVFIFTPFSPFQLFFGGNLIDCFLSRKKRVGIFPRCVRKSHNFGVWSPV